MIIGDPRSATFNHDRGAASPAHIGVDEHVMPLQRNIELPVDDSPPPFHPDIMHQFRGVFMGADQFTIQKYFASHLSFTPLYRNDTAHTKLIPDAFSGLNSCGQFHHLGKVLHKTTVRTLGRLGWA